MRYPTKQKRLLAIFEAYRAETKKTAVTMDEVATWAISHGLHPVPRRGDPEHDCLEWERRLDELRGVG